MKYRIVGDGVDRKIFEEVPKAQFNEIRGYEVTLPGGRVVRINFHENEIVVHIPNPQRVEMDFGACSIIIRGLPD